MFFRVYTTLIFYVFSCGIDPNIFGVSFNSILKELKKNGYAGKALHFEEEKICFCRKLKECVMYFHQNTTIQYPTAELEIEPTIFF